MTTSKILAFTSVSFKTGVSSLIVLGLVGCDGLARFNTKKDTPPTEPVVAEESAGTAASPASDPSAATETPPQKDKKMSNPLYEWKGDGRKVTRIVVNTNEQKARFYSGDEEIGWSTVATGLPKYPTPTGRFQVTEKVENKRSNLYGKVYGKGGRVLRSSVKVGRDPIPDGGRFEGAKMPFFMRLTDDGVGLHAGPIPNPGQPASHGCIRMPSKIAPVLFRHVSNGTPVTIEGKGPSYGDYVAKQRANAARRAEERRIAEQKRAAEAQKAQQVAQAAPSATDTATKPQDAANSERRETHAVAKDESVPATPAIDTANARETRMREPATQPESAGVETENTAASTPTTPTKPDEQPVAPASEAAAPTPATPNPGEMRQSISEEATPPAPAAATGLPSSIREGSIDLGPQPAAPAPASSDTRIETASSAEPTASSAPTRPTPEIQEAPAPQPVPAPKPTEPAPTQPPAAGPQPSAAPAAAPADSAAE